jgi:hypothetical protein
VVSEQEDIEYYRLLIVEDSSNKSGEVGWNCLVRGVRILSTSSKEEEEL